MRSSGHDQPYFADEVRDAPRVPLPRTPPAPSNPITPSTPSRPLPVDGPGEVELDPVTQARIRESAMRNASAARMFEEGRYDEALPLFEQALASCRSTLGNDHPDTMTVAGNLAVAYLAAGQRRKGIKYIGNNVSARARVLGDEHPMTLTARNALAAAHRLAGDADDAVALAKRVVMQRTRTLGSAHADTLSSRMELSLSLAAAGDLSSAYRILASTMNDAEENLGAQHAHTETLLRCGLSHGLIRDEV